MTRSSVRDSRRVEVTNGQINVFDIVVTDADGDDIFLSLTGDDVSFCNFDSILYPCYSPDFANPSDQNGDNVYMIAIEATDGERITLSNQIETLSWRLTTHQYMTY